MHSEELLGTFIELRRLDELAGKQSQVVRIALAWVADHEENRTPKISTSDWEALNSCCPKRYFLGSEFGCIDRWSHLDEELDIHKKIEGQAIWHFMSFVLEHYSKAKGTKQPLLKCDAYSGDLFVATRRDQRFLSDANKVKFSRSKRT